MMKGTFARRKYSLHTHVHRYTHVNTYTRTNIHTDTHIHMPTRSHTQIYKCAEITKRYDTHTKTHMDLMPVVYFSNLWW